jgi:hypothetical protein
MCWCARCSGSAPTLHRGSHLVELQSSGGRSPNPCHSRVLVRRRAVVLSSCEVVRPALQVRLGGAILTSFLPLEEALDDAVGAPVSLDIERAGAPVSLEIAVQVCAPPCSGAACQIGIRRLVLHHNISQPCSVRSVLSAVPAAECQHASWWVHRTCTR